MKAAIIGYGGMGFWHHQNIREQLPEIEVSAACDIRPELKAKAEENGIRFYLSPEEIWQDEEIDLITIATPNNFHKDLAIESLRRGNQNHGTAA